MTRLDRPILAAAFAALALAAAPRSAIAAPPQALASNPLLGPPGPPPITVRADFYLLNLAAVNERAETFEADAYLQFTWRDARLAFTPKRGGDGRRTLVDKDAEQALEGMWWPAIEFVNAVNPQVRNRALTLRPDGTVTYQLGVTSQFRCRLDFRRFPFDSQALEVRLQSFLYQNAEVRFVADPSRCGWAGEDSCDDLRVEGVGTAARVATPAGLGEAYSEFVATVSVRRSSAFYIWRIFFPTILIMAMSFTIYFIKIQELHDRVGISLSCMLACIATQFAMSFNLPKISYLTAVDRLYLVTYACIAFGAGVSVVEHALHQRNHPRLNQYNRAARWVVPLLYAAAVFGIVLPRP